MEIKISGAAGFQIMVGGAHVRIRNNGFFTVVVWSPLQGNIFVRKGVIRNRKSKKDRQCNDQRIKDKKPNNNQQNKIL